MSELKPCPFCNCEPEMIMDSDWQDKYVIECPNCGVQKRDEDSHDDAASYWNDRPVENEQQSQLAEYKAFMLGLELSSEDEARMLRMFDKYKKVDK